MKIVDELLTNGAHSVAEVIALEICTPIPLVALTLAAALPLKEAPGVPSPLGSSGSPLWRRRARRSCRR